MRNTQGGVQIRVYLCVFVLEANTHQIHSQIHPSLRSLSPPSGINPRQRALWTAMPPVANPDVERWESDEDSENSGDEREGDEQEVALSEAAILRLMA